MPIIKQLLIKGIAFLLLSLLINTATAQHKKSGEIGLTAGGSYYLGEFNKTPFSQTKLAFGAFYRHTVNTRFAFTGNFYYTKLSGEEANSDYIVPAISDFSSSLYEISSVAEFNFIPYLPGKPKRYYATPYVFAGMGLAYYPAGATNFILSIPFGMGAKYNINHRYMFGFYAGMRKTFTDKIDYEYSPTPRAESDLKQGGYEGNKDWYSIFGLSLSYKINYRMKCPAFD